MKCVLFFRTPPNKKKGNGGHMQLKLYKKTGPSPGEQSATTTTVASPEPEKRRDGLGCEGDGAAAILYGDSCEMVAKKIR